MAKAAIRRRDETGGGNCPECGNPVAIGFTCFFGCDDWRQIEADRRAGPDDDVVQLLADVGIDVTDGVAHVAIPRQAKRGES